MTCTTEDTSKAWEGIDSGMGRSFMRCNNKPNEEIPGGDCEGYIQCYYRVTHLLDSNLPLTSKDKLRIALACPDLARPKWNFWFDVKRRFESTRCVTLYIPGFYVVAGKIIE